LAAEYTARNAASLQQLKEDSDVEIRPFPDDVLRQLRDITDEVVAELAGQDSLATRINDSFQAYRKAVSEWTAISEHAILNAREL
jgi:TRAP-type mannitol/chloroaromatic compound transport system substrate-binding protein